MSFSREIRVNVSVSSVVEIQTSLVTSFDYDGETYTLNAPAEVGYFEDGRPFVVSNNSGQIVAVSTPASDANNDGYVGNGMMKNPGITSSDGGQGWDEYIADYPTKTTYEVDYNAALNVDPGASNTATWIAGESATFVKAFRHPNLTNNTAHHQAVLKYHYITILPEAPPVGTITPGAAATTKRLRSIADVNFTPRGYSLPASWPSIAEILQSVPDNLGLFAGGEARRRLRLDQDTGGSNDGYSGEITDDYARFVYALNSSDVTQSQREEMIRKILFFSNNVESLIDAGSSINSGAGQGGAIWLWVMAAAALLRDDTLHQKLRAVSVQPQSPFWITSANIGVPANGKSGVAAQTYLEEQIGMPHVEPDEVGTHHHARYFNIASDIIGWEAVAVMGFNQGPASFANGADMILNGGANDNTNPSAAILGLLARRNTWNENVTGSYPVSQAWRDAYSQVLGFGDYTPWQGPPEQPPLGGASAWEDPYFSTGSSGQIILDTQGVNWTTETITQTDVRYSLDNVQFIELSDVTVSGDSYTIANLLRGVPHWCGWRRHSASGVSPWSGNYPERLPILSGLDRSKVTTTGTQASAAPVNTVPPLIHALKYPGWAYQIWEPSIGSFGDNDVELAAGVGYWTGYPAPNWEGGDFTFQWKRNGANIPGATSQKYTRVAADAGTTLTCEVTCSTSQGSATITTAGVSCAAIQNPPAGTLIDTDFRGSFAITYEPELLSLSGSNANPSHLPTATPIDLGENFGAIFSDKTGGSPTTSMTLSRSASLSTLHVVTAEVAIVGSSVSDRGSFRLRIREVNGDDIVYDASLDGSIVDDSPNDRFLWTISDQFTTGASNGDLYVQVQWGSSTGGSGGADIYLTQLTIREA